MPKFGVVIFPGSNCDRDIIYVLKDYLKQPTVTLWHKDHDLQNVDVVILPGGFSYGDYLRSGAIARFSPIMQQVSEFADKGGIVWGICNGFQILTEAGLLPGALLRNENQQFICENLFITAANNETSLTQDLQVGKPYSIPIAHAEGRFYASAQTLNELEANGQVIFRYCNADGDTTPESNSNGSLNNIAGVCNTGKNVFGMMPHPERAADEMYKNTDGVWLFQSLINHLTELV
jgi:phosphoribosylformylglycinamidine synthase I